MSRAFQRRGDVIRMRLRDEELAVLRRLRDELHAMLTSPADDDPVIRRMFPAAVSGDDDADRELRDLMHDDLHAARIDALDELLGYLDRATLRRGTHVVDLVDEEPAVVLGVLNDLRLALGARIGFDIVAVRALAEDSSVQASLAMMDWFAMWQEQLLVALDASNAGHYDDHQSPDEHGAS